MFECGETESVCRSVEARLRCSLWSRQESLEERRLEAEQSLLGLKHRLDQLDSAHTHTHPEGRQLHGVFTGEHYQTHQQHVKHVHS